MTNGSDGITRTAVNGKQVFAFESHHHALIPWAEVRRGLQRAPRLLTLDYHTDTVGAFRGHVCAKTGACGDAMQPIMDAEITAIKFQDPRTVIEAVGKLRFDEQIDAALRSNILDLAFIIAKEDHDHIVSNEQHASDAVAAQDPSLRRQIQITGGLEGTRIIEYVDNPRAKPPYTYSIPPNRMIVLPGVDMRAAGSIEVTEEMSRAKSDGAIESEFLEDRLALINSVCSTSGIPSLFDEPFILDIDLDYFNTQKSIAPDDSSTFYGLIRRAAIVTIARESICVKSCQFRGEELTSDFLEREVMAHIAVATGLEVTHSEATPKENTNA